LPELVEKGSQEYAKTLGVKIILIDGRKMAELMIENNLGVTVHKTIELAVSS
jgi:restriction endonuclease Mrr